MDLESLEIKISRSENLPVLPQIVNSVLKLADDPNASPRSLEQVIERDPAITAKILRVANSAYYGLNRASSIGRAISVLGLNTIRSLVIGIAYQQVVAGRQNSQRFNKIDFWRHSLASAIGARVIAKLRIPAKADELYVAGMMHDLGLLILDRFCACELDDAISYAEIHQVKLLVAEQMTVRYDHAHIGGILAAKWGLTGLMQNVVSNHGRLDPSEPDFEAACIVSIADTLANQCGFRNNEPELAEAFAPAALKLLEIPTEQLDVIRTVMAQEVIRAQDAFQIK